MVIGHDTVEKLQEEGIKYLDDLEMVDKDFPKQLTDNLNRRGGQINVGGAMITTPDFKFGAKLQTKLKVASNLVRFYKTVRISIINTMIRWDPIIKYIKQEWEILDNRKGENVSDVPKIRKTLLIIKCTKYFANLLHRIVVKINIPLSYVIRKLDTGRIE